MQATGTATFNAATGTVTGISILNPGSGYTSAPTVTLTGGGPGVNILATAAATVTFGGAGYTSVPTVTFSGG